MSIDIAAAKTRRGKEIWQISSRNAVEGDEKATNRLARRQLDDQPLHSSCLHRPPWAAN